MMRKWWSHWTKPKAPARRPGRPPRVESLEARIVPGFVNAGSFHVHDTPTSVVVGDFNGDQIPDLVTANDLSRDVSVLLGNGDGSFQPAVNYRDRVVPNAIAAGDFNGDGTLDLAVADIGAGSLPGGVSIFLGNGDGTFRRGGSYLLNSGGGVGVAVGDFNGDGNLDVVAATISGASVLLGNGDGTFQPAVNYTFGRTVTEIATADFNGDGTTDLAAVDAYNHSVTILLGNGDGTFAIGPSYTVAGAAESVAAGDFNGDGVPDLVTANNNGTVSVLLGNGDGSFQPAVDYAASAGSFEVKVADFNGDGVLDIVAVSPRLPFLPNVSVLLGNGDGTFQPEQKFQGGNSPFYVATADRTGDGRQDLVVVNDESIGSVTILLNDGVWTGPAPGGEVRLAAEPRLPPAGSSTDQLLEPVTSSSATDQVLDGFLTVQHGDSPADNVGMPVRKGASPTSAWRVLETAALLGLDDLRLSLAADPGQAKKGAVSVSSDSKPDFEKRGRLGIRTSRRGTRTRVMDETGAVPTLWNAPGSR
jgi:hypothetical protein